MPIKQIDLLKARERGRQKLHQDEAEYESTLINPAGNFGSDVADPNALKEVKAYARLRLLATTHTFKVQYKSLNMRDYGEINSLKVKADTATNAEALAVKALKAQGIYNVQILKVTQV